MARKTSGLSQAMMDLQQQKQELEVKQQALREEIERRRHTEDALRSKQTELEKLVSDLRQAQESAGTVRKNGRSGRFGGRYHPVK